MKSRETRPVFITLTAGSWMVRYADRAERQRHLAAEFDARYSSREKVEGWVGEQVHLKLVSEPLAPTEEPPAPCVFCNGEIPEYGKCGSCNR